MFYCLDVPQFVNHPLKEIVVASKFWQLGIKLLQTSVCGFLCVHCFQFLWVNNMESDCWIKW